MISIQNLNKSSLAFLVLFFSSFSAFTQLAVGSQVYVLNEGKSGRKGSLGVVSSDTGVYQHLDSVAAYGNALLLSPTHLYVVNGYTEGNVLRYDLQNFNSQAITPNVGARGIAIYNNQLLVCGTEHPYFRVYDLASLNEVYHLDSTKVRSAREEVVVVNNKAYLSGYYGDTVVAVVDLVGQDFIKNIETSENPYQLQVIDNKVYIGCFTYNPDFTTNTTIHEVETTTDMITSTGVVEKADGFTSDASKIYLKKSNGKLLAYNPSNQQVDTLSNFQGFYYGFGYDMTTNLMFVSETDYVSTGSVGYLDLSSGFSSSMISADISPRAFAYQASPFSGIDNSLSKHYKLYPNPSTGNIWVNVTEPTRLRIEDIQAKTVKELSVSTLSEINLANYPKGLYIVHVFQREKHWTEKLILQ